MGKEFQKGCPEEKTPAARGVGFRIHEAQKGSTVTVLPRLGKPFDVQVVSFPERTRQEGNARVKVSNPVTNQEYYLAGGTAVVSRHGFYGKEE